MPMFQKENYNQGMQLDNVLACGLRSDLEFKVHFLGLVYRIPIVPHLGIWSASVYLYDLGFLFSGVWQYFGFVAMVLSFKILGWSLGLAFKIPTIPRVKFLVGFKKKKLLTH